MPDPMTSGEQPPATEGAPRLSRRVRLWAVAVCGVTGVVLVIAGFAVIYQVSDSFHARVDQTANEAAQWRPGVATETSVGIRLEFYRNTFEIVRHHPLLGVGPGNFAVVSHRLHGVEIYNGKPIFYSLGNFQFDTKR